MPASDNDLQLLAVVNKYKRVPPTASVASDAQFAGTFWPPAFPGSPAAFIRDQIRAAAKIARELAYAGAIVAQAALDGDEGPAATMMQNWFGAKGDGKWWQGACQILCQLDDAKDTPLKLYYRNSEVAGKPSDIPNEKGRPITRGSTRHYAETTPGDKDLRISLCERFFETSGGGWKLSLKGYSSAGGILVHEMSHNLCSTDDHDLETDWDLDCVGPAGSLLLAEQSPWRAWYNADNIAFFCEQAYFTLETPPPKKATPKPVMDIPEPPDGEISSPLAPKMSGSPRAEKAPLDLPPPPPPLPSGKDQLSDDEESDEEED